MKKCDAAKLLTIQEFCDLVKISRSTYFALQRLELGPHILRIGRAVRIAPKAVEDWLTQVGPEDEAAHFNSKTKGAVYGEW